MAMTSYVWVVPLTSDLKLVLSHIRTPDQVCTVCPPEAEDTPTPKHYQIHWWCGGKKTNSLKCQSPELCDIKFPFSLLQLPNCIYVVTEQVCPLEDHLSTREGYSEFATKWGLHQIVVSWTTVYNSLAVICCWKLKLQLWYERHSSFEY